MSETSPTPWRPTFCDQVADANGYTVAVAYNPADLHLIVASPDLLAAAQKALRLLGEPPDFYGDQGHHDVMRELIDAIAKATGETP